MTFVLLTSSCSLYNIDSVDTGEFYYPANSPDEVVYLENTNKDYAVIATVTVNGERKQRDFDEVIVKMKREAAILGGNAITDIRSDATGVWQRLPAQKRIGNAYVRANYMASVIVFTGADRVPMKMDTKPLDMDVEPLKTDTEPLNRNTVPINADVVDEDL